jgi:AraC-like DNA-binding protein
LSAVVIETWRRFDIRRIDDLSNAVLGADLEAIQMAGGCVRGSLAFAARDGVVFSSGLIDGNVMIRGALSKNAVTLVVVLQVGPGSRLWLDEVTAGNVGIVLPGDECDIFCTAGSLYVTAILTSTRLREEVAREGLSLNRSLVRKTGLHSTPIGLRALTCLRRQFASIHSSRTDVEISKLGIGSRMLRTVENHYAELPQSRDERIHLAGQAKIVHDARKYIRKNLARPISVEALSIAAETSPRSLFRAFSAVLGDTPHSYVRRLRLHRVRQELMSQCATSTVSGAAHKWGMGGDLGRLSQNYRDLFGENPSTTLALGRSLQQDDAWL